MRRISAGNRGDEEGIGPENGSRNHVCADSVSNIVILLHCQLGPLLLLVLAVILLLLFLVFRRRGREEIKEAALWLYRGDRPRLITAQSLTIRDLVAAWSDDTWPLFLPLLAFCFFVFSITHKFLEGFQLISQPSLSVRAGALSSNKSGLTPYFFVRTWRVGEKPSATCQMGHNR